MFETNSFSSTIVWSQLCQHTRALEASMLKSEREEMQKKHMKVAEKVRNQKMAGI